MRLTTMILLPLALLALSITRAPLHTTTVVLEAEGFAQLVPPMRVARGEAAQRRRLDRVATRRGSGVARTRHG